MTKSGLALVGAAFVAGALSALAIGVQPTQGADAPQFVKVGETYVCVVPGHGAATVTITQVMQPGCVNGGREARNPDARSTD